MRPRIWTKRWMVVSVVFPMKLATRWVEAVRWAIADTHDALNEFDWPDRREQ